MLIRRHISLAAVLLFLSCAVFAQKKSNEKTENYSLILSQAEDDFERGNLSRIPRNVQRGFVKDGFTKEERIRAHRLLTLVHLYSDNEPAAEVELIELLKSDPEHPINPLTDSEEFQYLYSKFRTKPIFRIAINGGLNRTQVSTLQAFGTRDAFDTNETISAGIGIQYGVAIERELFFRGFELSLGGLLSTKKYSSTNQIILGEYIEETESRASSPFSELSQTESMSFLDISLIARYNVNIDGANFVPFIYGGIEANLMLNASRKEATRSGAQTISAADQPLFDTNERNKQNYSIIGGVGFKYKVKTNFLKFELKYAKGQTNVVNPENRYANETTIFRLAQVDDNQSLDVISANIGYVISIYNPKKLKKFRN